MRKFLLLFFTGCSTYVSAQTDTIRICFNKADTTLSEAALHKIDSLIYYEVLPANRQIQIIAYPAFKGKKQRKDLSAKRVASVMDYLLRSGYRPADLVDITGRNDTLSPITYPVDVACDNMVLLIPAGYRQQPQHAIAELKPNETLRLEHIYFFPGSARIQDISNTALNKLADVLKTNPKIKVRIEGHVCCSNSTDGELLSTARARSVYNYLIKEGIDKRRLDYIGFGRTQPLIHPEANAEDERRNRRVEIRVL